MELTFFDFPVPPWHVAAIVALGHAVGSFGIGVCGLGGVVYLPLLMLLPGVSLETGLACAFAAPLVGCFQKLWLWQNRGELYWRPSIELCGLIFPGAALGAYAKDAIPTRYVMIALGFLCIANTLQVVTQLWARWRAARVGDSVGVADGGAWEQLKDTGAPACPDGFEQRDAPHAHDVEFADARDSPGAGFSDGVSECTAVTMDGTPEARPQEASAPIATREPLGGDVASIDTAPAPSFDELLPTNRHLLDPAPRYMVFRAVLGGVVGFLSALTGTGGPIFIYPLITLCCSPKAATPVLVSVTLPYALINVVINLCFVMASSTVDLGLCMLVCLYATVFTVLGAYYGVVVSEAKLKGGIGAMLLATGIVTLANHLR